MATTVISAEVFAMIAAFRGSSGQAAASAKPFVALSLPQKLRRISCVC